MTQRLTKRVVYRKTDIKQLVKVVDPKPTATVVYEFSNGRQFKEKS